MSVNLKKSAADFPKTSNLTLETYGDVHTWSRIKVSDGVRGNLYLVLEALNGCVWALNVWLEKICCVNKVYLKAGRKAGKNTKCVNYQADQFYH